MSTSARAGAGTTDDRAPIDSRRTRGPEAALDSRPPMPGRAHPTSAPGPVAPPRTVPERRRPDAGSLRMLAVHRIASASALTAAMLPSVAPATDAGVGSPPTTGPTGIADAPAPSVRHVKR